MIVAECGECLTSHKLADDAAGRRFRCKQCQATVTAPRVRSAKRGSRSPSSQRRRKMPARSSSAFDDFDDYDDNFDRQRSPRRSAGSQRKRNQRTRKGRTGRRSQSDESFFNSYVNKPHLWLGVPAGIAVFVALVCLSSEWAGSVLTVGVLLICVIVAIVSNVHFLVLAFQESAACGLMVLFVPFYALFYLFTRWETQRPPFVLNLSMIVTCILTSVARAVILR